MNELLKKIESTSVSEYITEQDKSYCNELQDKYSMSLAHLHPLLEQLTQVAPTLMALAPEKSELYYYLSPIEKLKEECEQMMYDLHDGFIHLVESYFQDAYKIEFTSLPLPESKVISIELILGHIIAQVGTDLVAAGKQQVIKNFQKRFVYPRNKPELIRQKVSFPFFYRLSNSLTTALNYNEQDVNALLHAIALFMHDSATLPLAYNLQFKEWQNGLEFNKPYTLEAEIKIKFFRNRRLDLAFLSPDITEKFWDLFQLENITDLNNTES